MELIRRIAFMRPNPAAGLDRSFSVPMTAAIAGSPSTRGLKSLYELPGPEAEVGHCVHRMALHPSRPDVLFMQKHWDVMRSDNAGEHWAEVSGNLPTDFGFPIEVHSHQPETIYVVPITSDSLLTMVCACALRGACFVVTPSMQPVAATCPTRRCRSVE